MLGMFEITTSNVYIHFSSHPWYQKSFEHKCSDCYNVVYNLENINETREQCCKGGLSSLAIKLYPLITTPGKYRIISDFETYIFSVITRIFSGASVPMDNFIPAIEMVTNVSRTSTAM